MDLKGQGFEATVVAKEQTDDWLVSAAAEIAEAAKDRGLELPAFAGGVAVEASETGALAQEIDLNLEILAQLGSACRVYGDTLGALNGDRKRKDKVELATAETVVAEFEDWFTDERATFVKEAMEADPELSFRLTATPNVTASKDEILTLGKQFGQNQPYGTSTWEEIYGRYTPEQLSGTNPADGKAVKFRLIPNKLSEDMYGTVTEQRAKLEKMQADKGKFLGVQSVLEDVVFWRSLRAEGDSLTEGVVFERTYARHFDLPEQRIDGFVCVPDSYVYDDGQPSLSYSYARLGDHARVSVG